MTIKEVMSIGCKGMNKNERAAEQERRLKVVEQINLLDSKRNGCKAAVKECGKGTAEAKKLNGKIRHYARQLDKIKAAESLWLREAAWFLYC